MQRKDFLSVVGVDARADALKPVALEHALRCDVIDCSHGDDGALRAITASGVDDGSDRGCRMPPTPATCRYAVAELDLTVAGLGAP